MRCLICNEIIDDIWLDIYSDSECRECYEFRTGECGEDVYINKLLNRNNIHDINDEELYEYEKEDML